MITKHNISSLFEFVKKQKKSNILRIDLINKSFVLSQHSKTDKILIDKNGVNFNFITNIDDKKKILYRSNWAKLRR